MPKSRLESFSDCIIAFAVTFTLLIYDFHLQSIDADHYCPANEGHAVGKRLCF